MNGPNSPFTEQRLAEWIKKREREKERAGGMAQAVECLHGECKTLSSNPRMSKEPTILYLKTSLWL